MFLRIDCGWAWFREKARRVEDGGLFGFQYIVTMNEDAVPAEMPTGFDFEKCVLPTHLTDATEDGGSFLAMSVKDKGFNGRTAKSKSLLPLAAQQANKNVISVRELGDV